MDIDRLLRGPPKALPELGLDVLSVLFRHCLDQLDQRDLFALRQHALLRLGLVSKAWRQAALQIDLDLVCCNGLEQVDRFRQEIEDDETLCTAIQRVAIRVHQWTYEATEDDESETASGFRADALLISRVMLHFDALKHFILRLAPGRIDGWYSIYPCVMLDWPILATLESLELDICGFSEELIEVLASCSNLRHLRLPRITSPKGFPEAGWHWPLFRPRLTSLAVHAPSPMALDWLLGPAEPGRLLDLELCSRNWLEFYWMVMFQVPRLPIVLKTLKVQNCDLSAVHMSRRVQSALHPYLTSLVAARYTMEDLAESVAVFQNLPELEMLDLGRLSPLSRQQQRDAANITIKLVHRLPPKVRLLKLQRCQYWSRTQVAALHDVCEERGLALEWT